MVTEEEWQGEVAKGRRLRFVSAIAGVLFCSGMVFLAINSSPRNFAIYIVAVDEIWSISAAQERKGPPAMETLLRGALLLFSASGLCILTFRAAMSASSASTTACSDFPFAFKPTANCIACAPPSHYDF